MTENCGGHTAQTSIEDVVRDMLNGEAQQNALDYVTFLKENGIELLSHEGVWNYADDSVLYMDGKVSVPGPWTIWANCPRQDNPDLPADERLKSFAWEHANTCASCGCGSQPGLSKTLFGKAFDNLCTATLMFTDPSAEDLKHIKALALMNKRAKSQK